MNVPAFFSRACLSRFRIPSEVTTDILAFEVADRRFGIAAHTVAEVTRVTAVAPLPKAPAIMEGVINIRGTLAPVLDIRQRFGLPPRPITLDQHLLIARAGARLVALRVDRALELIAVDERAIESAAGIAPGAEYVAGLARLPDGLLVIHDLATFLSLDEVQQMERALHDAKRDIGS